MITIRFLIHVSMTSSKQAIFNLHNTRLAEYSAGLILQNLSKDDKSAALQHSLAGKFG